MLNVLMIFLMLLVSVGVLCMFYAFADVITKKRIWKYVITIIMAALVVFIYWETNKPKVVQMKEDVLYIKPKAKV